MKDEFTWLRRIILISSGALVLSWFVRVYHETAQHRASLETAAAAAVKAATDRTPGTQTALLPHCRIVPTDRIRNGSPGDPGQPVPPGEASISRFIR